MTSIPKLFEVEISDRISKLKNCDKYWHSKMKASLSNGRHENETCIVLVGLSGAGKSSTVNSLLKQKIVKTNSVKSETRRITEYRTEIELPGMPAILNIVDTPGLEDGDIHTRIVAATLKSYLDQKRAQFYRFWKPSLILIVADITDKRFEGVYSKFSLMLTFIYQLCKEYFDEHNNNVLLILTHFMSLPSTFNQEFPHSIISSYLSVFKRCCPNLSFSKDDIVLAENRTDLYPQVVCENGWFLLPCNQHYPLNLYEKAQFLFQIKCVDPIGEAILQNAVASIDKLVPQVPYPEWGMLPEHHENVLEATNIFNNNQEIPSELDKELEKFWKDVPEPIRKSNMSALASMQSGFKQLGFNFRTDLPKYWTGKKTMLSQLGSDRAVLCLLNSLGINDLPKLNCEIITGKCYSWMTDKTINSTIFAENDDMTISRVGLIIPSDMDLHEENTTLDVTHVHESVEEYVQQRIADLGLSIDAPVTTVLKVTARAGYNVVKDSELANIRSTTNLKSLKERRLYKLTIQSGAKLCPEFIKQVSELPEFNEEDKRSCFEYSQFFDKYGTHIIKSAYIGGVVEIEVCYEDKMVKTLNRNKIKSEVLAEVKRFGIKSNGTIEKKNVNASNSSVHIGSHYVKGGTLDSHSTDPNFDLDAWVQGLYEKPVMLDRELSLAPIEEFVRRVPGKDRSYDVRTAFKYFFDIELKKKSIPPPPIVSPFSAFVSRFVNRIIKLFD